VPAWLCPWLRSWAGCCTTSACLSVCLLVARIWLCEPPGELVSPVRDGEGVLLPLLLSCSLCRPFVCMAVFDGRTLTVELPSTYRKQK